jgi:hypothetical protein
MQQRGQLSFGVGIAQNRNLFPVHFLEDRLPEWPEYVALEPSALLVELSAIWERERDLLPGFNEEQTEDRWVRPILKALGFHYTARPALAVGGRRREPDYALFLSEESRARGEGVDGNGRYAEAVAVLEAKRFDRPLDQRRPAGGLSEDPVAQIIYYVSTTQVPFGILTNGRIWRLYAQQGDLVEGAYYEVDLVALLEAGDPRGLRAFVAFFAAGSFRPDEAGRSFLDLALGESRANAIQIGDALQRQVFKAVPNIAAGLLGDEERSAESLAAAFEHSLVFLYRLLFCLHAEARRLLPIDSPHYLEYSVRKQRLELTDAIDRGRVFGRTSDRLYNELEALFKLVAAGDEGLGVNEYNGDLFTASKHPWLEGRIVPDELLAPALDGLFRLRGQAIDYRDLSVRQLGTIYEQLLEYRLVVSAGGGLELERASGRRDSGSYFTPEPIVDLIIERTLEPLLESRSQEIQRKGLRGKRALDAFLELRVADPAMGSGHFLVSAAAYIAKFIATDPSYDGALDWQGIERLVAERCIYGVDLNPMAVELARLSLWLATVRSDVPLTFLSNLRVGNSLVGADLNDLLASDVSLFAEQLARDAESLLARTAEIAGVETSSGAKVHEKERIAAAAEGLRLPLHEYADESIAQYFSEETPMFHWEIEFPEVFLSGKGRLRSDRGFDAVIGNPPYIRIQSLDRELANWCRHRFQTAHGAFDAYLVFIERAAALLGPKGRLGFIVPNKFLKLDSGKKLRAQLAASQQVEEIIDFGDAQLFEGATNYTSVLILDSGANDSFSYRKVRGGAPGIPTPREIVAAPAGSYEASAMGEDPWVLSSGAEKELFDSLQAGARSLAAVTGGIFTGVQTSADAVYIVEDRGPRGGGRLVYSRASGEELLLEPDLLHPLSSGAHVKPYALAPSRELILFPYRRAGDEMKLLSEKELSALPRIEAYLRTHEESLRGRERGAMDHAGWYAFGRNQNLGLQDLPKLAIPRLCDRLHAGVDAAGSYYFDNVDVNGILPGPEGPDLWTLSCLLNSKVLGYVFRILSVPFRGDYLSANRQFIAPLPIQEPSADQEERLSGLGKTLAREAGIVATERDGLQGWLAGVLGVRIGELAGRTRLATPDLLDVSEIIEILCRNRTLLSLDPTARSFRERLEAEHEASCGKIEAALRSFRAGEAEVDDLVFDLYQVDAAGRGLIESSVAPHG